MSMNLKVFNAGASGNWNTRVGNWWNNLACTSQASTLPDANSTVVLLAGVSTPPSSPVTVAKLVAFSPTGALLSLSLTNVTVNEGAAFVKCGVSGDLTATCAFVGIGGVGFTSGILTGSVAFLASSEYGNNGRIDGDVALFDSYNDYGGRIDGNVAFFGGAKNTGQDGALNPSTVSGNAAFFGWSVNDHTGGKGNIVTGSAAFFDTASCGGAVGNHVAMFGSQVTMASTMAVSGNGVFIDVAQMTAGTVSGDAAFLSTSSKFGSAVVSGDVAFLGGSSNANPHTGTAAFIGTDTNNSSTVTGDATFIGNVRNKGTVTGKRLTVEALDILGGGI